MLVSTFTPVFDVIFCHYYICDSTLYSNDHTSAVLRLECSSDCMSGSVGHQQNIFRSFSHCLRLS